jgi:TolB-like protein|tara:strand:- start:13 stop:822 length:810 start_codon:yes stop_codon:yes gene_type:complete
MNRLFISLIFISSIFSQQTVAILDFEGIGVSQEEARALSSRFGSEFLDIAGNKYTLLERQAMGEVLNEQGFQQSGCVSSECAVEVGAALGAQLIIIGSISNVGSIFSVNARMLDVETAQILKSINYDQVGDIGLLLTNGMREAAAKMLDVGVKPANLDIAAIDKLPVTNNPALLLQYALESIKKEQYSNAKYFCNKALQADSTFAPAIMCLAQISSINNEPLKAANYIKQAIKKDYDNENYREEYAKLKIKFPNIDFPQLSPPQTLHSI